MNFELAQLALIFAPGLIWANIDEKYGEGKPPNTVKFFVRSFLFGLTTYVVLYLIYYLLSLDTNGLRFEFNSSEGQSALTDLYLKPADIFWSIPLSLCLSIVWLYIVSFKLLRKTLHSLGATRRISDGDLWSTILNEDSIGGKHIHFHDTAKGLIYTGLLDKFSENEIDRELVLLNVTVYSNDHYNTEQEGDSDTELQELFKARRLYVSCEKNSFLLEFPNNIEEEGENDGK